ncbi:phage tail assembly protein T [Variovorax sp. LT1R16]|uniref:phage tail assembly protein T n=1 Tax=Variovorax sp. LT1R16 TaxID=3443728 RepID=UPI003F44FC0D
MGARLSVQEFAEWQVIFSAEQLHPAVARIRHAQVLAATYQGQSTKRSGKGWDASDFLAADPWMVRKVAPVVQGAQARRMAALSGRGRKR